MGYACSQHTLARLLDAGDSTQLGAVAYAVELAVERYLQRLIALGDLLHEGLLHVGELLGHRRPDEARAEYLEGSLPHQWHGKGSAKCRQAVVGNRGDL